MAVVSTRRMAPRKPVSVITAAKAVQSTAEDRRRVGVFQGLSRTPSTSVHYAIARQPRVYFTSSRPSHALNATGLLDFDAPDVRRRPLLDYCLVTWLVHSRRLLISGLQARLTAKAIDEVMNQRIRDQNECTQCAGARLHIPHEMDEGKNVSCSASEANTSLQNKPTSTSMGFA